MNHLQKYQQLKAESEKAYNEWSVSQEPMDWEWFMQCETAVASYAFEHEEEIFDECGDNYIPNE